MQARRIREVWRKEGWLLVALAAAVLLCLTLGGVETASLRTEEETRLSQVLSAMDGAGQVEVAIYYEETDAASVPCGAVVVADGASDVAVRLKLTRAVTTLLGIETSRVEVFQRKGGSAP